jgi:hypothetical protein
MKKMKMRRARSLLVDVHHPKSIRIGNGKKLNAAEESMCVFNDYFNQQISDLIVQEFSNFFF